MLGLASKTLMLSEWTAAPWCGAVRVGCGFCRTQKSYVGSSAGAGLNFLGFLHLDYTVAPSLDQPGGDAPAGKGP